MLIAQVSDPHIKLPGKLAYKTVDTAQMLRACVRELQSLRQQPDLVVLTGDLVDFGTDEEYAHLREILSPLRQRIVVVPGNHDARATMRAAFADGGYFQEGEFLNFAIDDDYPVRLVGLDTLIPGKGSGEVCARRLDWLDRTLAQMPDAPTMIMMHHPPFRTGIGHMDKLGLTGADEFAQVVSRHPQVELIVCGHLHRTIRATVGGRPALTCPSPAHQVALDIDPNAPSAFRMEPPGFMLHWWNGTGLVSHTATIGEFAGPFPFFDAKGRLID